MADEIVIEPRRAEGSLGLPAGAVIPVATNIPVTHKGRKIGTASLDGYGHVVMEIHDEFDQAGIFRMFNMGEASGFSLGVNDA